MIMTEQPEHLNETMEGEGVNAVAVALAIILFAIVLFAIIVFLTAFYRVSERSVWESKSFAAREDKFINLSSAQQAELTSYGVVNPSKGIVSIPIDVAMEIIVRENSFKNQVSALREATGAYDPPLNISTLTGFEDADHTQEYSTLLVA